MLRIKHIYEGDYFSILFFFQSCISLTHRLRLALMFIKGNTTGFWIHSECNTSTCVQDNVEISINLFCLPQMLESCLKTHMCHLLWALTPSHHIPDLSLPKTMHLLRNHWSFPTQICRNTCPVRKQSHYTHYEGMHED